MKSTGEVMGTGDTFGEAFGKASLGASADIPTSGNVIISVRDTDKPFIVDIAKRLKALGFNLLATTGTAVTLKEAGLEVTIANKVHEGRPHMVDMIKNDEISFIINTTEGRKSIESSAEIRRSALQHKVFYTTTFAAAEASVLAIEFGENTNVRRLQDLH